MGSRMPDLNGTRRTAGGPSLLLLGLMTFVGPLSANMFVPSFPAMERELSVTLADLQWTLTLYFVFFGALQLVVGPTSDRIGPRPVFFAGFGIFAVASIGAALAPDITTLVIARTFQALGAATALVIPRAAVQDTRAGEEAGTAMAFVAMLQSIAPALAPFLGGLFETFLGWRASFWFLALWAGAIMLVCLRAFPETRPADAGPPMPWSETFGRYGKLLRAPRFLGYTFNLSFMVAIFFGFLVAGPNILQIGYGLSALVFSWVMVAIALGFLVGNFITTRLTPRVGLDRMLLGASVLILVAMAVLLVGAGNASPWWVIAPLLAYGLGNGVVFPPAIAGATGVDRTIAGAAASFMGAIQFAVAAATTFAMGTLLISATLPFAQIALGFALLSLAAMALVMRRPHGAPERDG